MDNETLKNALDQLHAALGQTKTVDEDQSELLHHLVNDVQELLARSGDLDPAKNKSINARLTQAVELFEITHPFLTEQINKLLNILSSAGI